MKSIVLGIVGSAALGVALVAQTPSSSSPAPAQQKPSTEQQQQTATRTETLTGCVYQASDQPTVYGLRRTADEGSTSSARGTGGSGTTGGAATGSTGTGTPATGGTPGAAGTMDKDKAGSEGAWYRLSSSAAQDLKQFVGRAVRVTGMVAPGKDEKGVDILIHRVDPQKTVVTAIDLKPAPELKIQSITPTGGQCPQGAGKN